MRPTWGVVPTKGRHGMVRDLIASLHGNVGGVVVVDNNDAPDPILEHEVPPHFAVVNIHYPGFPPNLSELYNIGMDALTTEHASTEWNVALFNDDVVVPPGWGESLDAAMRATTAVMAYVDRMNRSAPVLYTTPPVGQWESATVWACMLRGEAGMRFDESMRWWYSDNDLDLQCRRAGGTLAVPGVIPQHLHPSEQTFASTELSAQTHRDEVTFNDKWRGVVW